MRNIFRLNSDFTEKYDIMGLRTNTLILKSIISTYKGGNCQN